MNSEIWELEAQRRLLQASFPGHCINEEQLTKNMLIDNVLGARPGGIVRRNDSSLMNLGGSVGMIESVDRNTFADLLETPARAPDKKPVNETVREKLQRETDEWLKKVDYV